MWSLLNLFVLFLCSFVSTCPDGIDPMQNLDLKEFTNGRWFEVARYRSYEGEKDADCVYGEFDNSVHPYKYTAHEVVNGTKMSFEGLLDQASEEKRGILLESMNINGEISNFTSFVLDTDYKTYAMTYFCRFDEARQKEIETAWITSRTPKLSDDAKTAVTKYIDAHQGLNKKNFVWNHFTHEACLIDL